MHQNKYPEASTIQHIYKKQEEKDQLIVLPVV